MPLDPCVSRPVSGDDGGHTPLDQNPAHRTACCKRSPSSSQRAFLLKKQRAFAVPSPSRNPEYTCIRYFAILETPQCKFSRHLLMIAPLSCDLSCQECQTPTIWPRVMIFQIASGMKFCKEVTTYRRRASRTRIASFCVPWKSSVCLSISLGLHFMMQNPI